MYYKRGNPVHRSTVEPLSIMDALTDLSEDGDISTDSLIDVDGDVIGPDLLGQSTSSLLSLTGRIHRTHVTRRE